MNTKMNTQSTQIKRSFGLTIVKASHLPHTWAYRRPKAYVKVEIEDIAAKTRTADKGLEPSWDEYFKYTNLSPDSMITFQLFHDGHIIDELLFYAELDVDELLRRSKESPEIVLSLTSPHAHATHGADHSASLTIRIREGRASTVRRSRRCSSILPPASPQSSPPESPMQLKRVPTGLSMTSIDSGHFEGCTTRSPERSAVALAH